MALPRPFPLSSVLLLAACSLLWGCDRDRATDDAGLDPAADASGSLPKPEAGAGSVTGMPRPGNPDDASRPIAGSGTPTYADEVPLPDASEGDIEGVTYAPAGDSSPEVAAAGANPPPATASLPARPPEPPSAPQPRAVVVPLERNAPLPPPPPPQPPQAEALPVPPPAPDDPAAE